jgi:hypothetical protein
MFIDIILPFHTLRSQNRLHNLIHAIDKSQPNFLARKCRAGWLSAKNTVFAGVLPPLQKVPIRFSWKKTFTRNAGMLS